MEDEEEQDLLEAWYELIENRIPVAYSLHNVETSSRTTHEPNGEDEWEDIAAKMVRIFKSVMPPNMQNRYLATGKHLLTFNRHH